MKKDKANRQADENQDTSEMIWDIIRTFMYILIAAILALLILKYVGQRTVVNGASMNNTLADGDNLIVDKITYRFSDPKRFDIIVFPFKENGEELNYIKRIIGLPGETVLIKDGKIYINGMLLEEDYGLEDIKNAGYAESPVALGDDEYFVLGDNRNNSKDSRELDQYSNPIVGVIHRSTIMGKAWLRIYPFSDFGFLH